MSKRVLVIGRCYDCPHVSPEYSDGHYCYLIALINAKEHHIEVDIHKTIPDECPLLPLRYAAPDIIMGKA